MDDRDLRQLEKMCQQIDSFKNGAIRLDTLIGDLIFLRDALSQVAEDWEHKFTDRIADLESAYSYALEKNAGELDLMTGKIVDDALPQLMKLIEQQKNA